MGTVGLSFGSPTSGAGFDVTSTVNQIVSNLQAVETPWKNQLTSLTAQDTALTSIGSDLSTLSSAMQALTDFQGVLSEKQGSSSDTDVLTLSSASSSSVAGSHSIEVTSLASTSSYVSDTITNAGDILAGSLSISVGGTAQQVITINSSDNTLATLATAINAGNYGVSANVVTDASGSRLSLVSKTSGAGGNISITSNSIQDSSTGSSLAFSQTQSGADAQLKVDGATVSSASNTVTNAIQGVTFQLLSAAPGTMVQVEITNNNSDVESAVNSFVTAYNKMLGDINTEEGNDANGNPEPLYGSPTLATLQSSLQSALTFVQPANVVASTSLGGSDTVGGSIDIAVGGGVTQTVTVPAGTTLSGLADAINAANVGVTASIVTAGGESTISFTSATSGPAGAITVDGSNLIDSSTNAAVEFGSGQSSGVTSLTQLGVTVNDDGTLALDGDTLDSMLNSNYQDVVNFFQPSGTYTTFGGNFTTTLNNLGTTATDGALNLALQENAAVEKQLNTNISNEETIISAQKIQLTTELNQANFTLTEIPQQLQSINELYSAITGYNENQNG